MRLSWLSAAFVAAFAWSAEAAEEGEIKSVSVRTASRGLVRAPMDMLTSLS